MLELSSMTEMVLDQCGLEIPNENSSEEEIENFKDEYVEALDDLFSEWMEDISNEWLEQKFRAVLDDLDDVIHNPNF